MQVKMNDATATSAVDGFNAALNRMPLAARRTLTYDQGREMARHAEITQRTSFCDPHSPWQHGSTENINGLSPVPAQGHGLVWPQLQIPDRNDDGDDGQAS